MNKLLALLLALPLSANAAGAPVIGVASAVRGSVKSAGVVIETGRQVFSHDKVATGPDSKLQILLLDESSFTVGPNSEMELDEFVFDPKTPVNDKVKANILKGSFRFVTGKIARRDPSKMSIKTPVGTIGIRGTMGAGSVNGSEGTFVLLGPGPNNDADEKPAGITVGNDQGKTDVDQDGWGVTVKAGEAPSKPFQLTPGQLDGLMGGLASAPKGGSQDNGDKTAASEASGENTAAGKANAADAFAAIDAAQGEQSAFASQQFSAPTTPTWQDVIAIPGGTGKYAGSASFYDCTSGTCTGPAVGTMSFAMDINFGAKTLGGGASIVNMSAPGTSQSIPLSSYAGKTGDATITSGFMTGAFAASTLELLNSGGQTAGAAALEVRYNNTPNIYGGSVGGPLQ
jgi:hypothetical protein